MEGLCALCERLFGVTFRDAPLLPGEAWAPGVRKLLAQHADEGPLGVMYLDLRPRPRKLPGAAHFVIRAGRRRGDVLPRVALVANLAEGETAALSHGAVELLHHEWGHAMHSLLSRTTYQHLSGTRGATDVIEAPSTLLERLAWRGEALTLWARAADGTPLPVGLLRKLASARRAFAATDALQQVVHATADLALHSAARSEEIDASFLEHAVMHASARYAPWPAQPAGWEQRFGHIVGYGGSYYSYLYGRALSGAAWRRTGLADNPLSRHAGMLLWTHMLRPGGSLPPAQAFGALLGEGAMRVLGGGAAEADAPCPRLALQDILAD